jgi:hypothetical protein
MAQVTARRVEEAAAATATASPRAADVSLRLYYRLNAVAGQTPLAISSNFRLYTLDVTQNAEEGSVALSTLELDDPDGTLTINPLTHIWGQEDQIAGSSNTQVFHGYIADREYGRGDSLRTTSARKIKVNFTDGNDILSRRILTSSNANRPAETDVARVQWIANVADGQLLIDDTRFLATTGAVHMDAVDYRGQFAFDVLNDCAQASGKNFWVPWFDGVGFGLWYDFATSTAYSSSIRLSNDLADIDSSLTFAISEDTTLARDPSRLYSGIYLPYDGGNIYERNATTFSQVGARDAAMPSLNVKSQAKATARALRYLADLNDEEDRITTTFTVPAAKVNWLNVGMRCQFRATHFPGYNAFVWLRVLSRQVKQVSEEFYEVTVVLSSSSAVSVVACASATASQTLQPNLQATSIAPGNVFYWRPGIAEPNVPTTGIGAWNFPAYNSGGVDYAGDCAQNELHLLVIGDGTLAIDTRVFGAARNLTGGVWHETSPGTGFTVQDSSFTGVSGTTLNVTVSSHGQTKCAHTVKLGDVGDLCGQKWGFAGAVWTKTV